MKDNDGQTPTERIATSSGMELAVERHFTPGGLTVVMRAHTGKQCVLHWGLRAKGQSGWHSLPPQQWPQGTNAAGPNALQTPFQKENGESRISINLSPADAKGSLEFALFFPENGQWDNNSRNNYQVAFPDTGGAIESMKKDYSGTELKFERVFEVDGGGHLAAMVTRDEKGYLLALASDVPLPLLLHWGITRRSQHEWLQPPESIRPAGTVLFGGHTTETPFRSQGSFARLELVFPEAEAPLGIQFVLKQGEGRWLKYKRGNFYVPLLEKSGPISALSSEELAGLSQRIVQAEMNSGSWTLMHRFNLCHDLLEAAAGNSEALCLLYVWLRYSAMRQLTWQRNYNTKPRELSHAQDRLANRLAELYQQDAPNRQILRLMLGTVGRGGDGQRIRDEILQIMHRHHVKEVTGHFLEEWHQKLHNNTTPDDVVICEAYLEFLRSNGNLDRFYETLKAGGVTRERLESFERPIRTNPNFVDHLKEGLIHDFQNFLKTLNAVHSSTDLETAIHTARERLEGDSQSLLWDIWNQRHAGTEALVSLVHKITEARRRLVRLTQSGQHVRPLLYLDLALEQMVRTVVERNLHQHLQREQLVALVGSLLENVALSAENDELRLCFQHWTRLSHDPAGSQFEPLWALQAKSVTDRIGRALADWTDNLYRRLQPKAELLGQAFGAENWAINLFSEEVVRGSSLGFALSMVLHQLERILRQSAGLSDWQIVSRGRGSGRVEVVEVLREVQAKKFEGPSIVIADKVLGDEELPKEVVAVIAPDVTDLVSHVAVRARNAQILFASCSDPAILQELKQLSGKLLQVETSSSGDVIYKQVDALGSEQQPPPIQGRVLKAPRTQISELCLSLEEFTEKTVGGKSLSQKRLQGNLPEGVGRPGSVALPFGCFENVLERAQNTGVASKCRQRMERAKRSNDVEALKELQELVLTLEAPEDLKQAMRNTFEKAGLPWPDDWPRTWRCVKQVWASKWNERAALSRRRLGIKDEDLFMAVLIQPVVEADYAFVIHTVNPSSGNRDELYGEIVLGLGETLVGNFPGRALSFVWDRRHETGRLLAFPSKSVGLYGGGLIFRSDSNGEDLAGYAGAGLYDSILEKAPREVALDYSQEPLVWDEGFRSGILAGIGRLGIAIERTLGSPQDIEGVVARKQYYVVQSRPQVGLDNSAQ